MKKSYSSVIAKADKMIADFEERNHEPEITGVSLMIEKGGKTFAVAMPAEKLYLVVRFAAGLCEKGLPVIAMSEDYKFKRIGEDDTAQVVD